MNIHLPTLNASLNGLAGIFLILGWWAIKSDKRKLHQKLMMAAFTSSTLFLCSYIYYHLTIHGVTRYQGLGIKRVIYFFILGTHTPLAVIIVPFCIMAIWHALKQNYAKHTRITKWLFPAWLYVSVTGVLIYVMLYLMKP